MKKFTNPEMEVVTLMVPDVIATSNGGNASVTPPSAED